MRERSLLERLRHPGDVHGRGGDSLEALAESVLRHLRKMLNTRQGSSRTVPDYGIPDLGELVRAFPVTRQELENGIRSSIEKYEPRLQDVTVRFAENEDDILTLAFEITARIVTSDEEAGVWFVTRIDPDGHLEISG